MKVSWQGFLGKNHSWSIVAQNISRTLIQKGHQVHLCSTNSYEHFPKDLEPYVVESFDSDYDLELSYTAMKNFPLYLNHSRTSKKFGIWAWEFNGRNNANTFPEGFAKTYKTVHKVLAPSNYCKQGFANAGVPKEMIEVVPHGVNECFISGTDKYSLNTDRKTKFFLNVGGQVHARKGIPGTLEAWGRAFTNKDDVILVVKANKKRPEQPFELYWPDLLSAFSDKYPMHAPVVTISEFIPDISALYRACDVVVSGSNSEGFNMPALEALHSNNLLIVSDYSGSQDFCNDNNSLLIKGKEVRCPPNYQYWGSSNNAVMFEPDKDHYASLMQKAAKEKDDLLKSFQPEIQRIKERYTWSNVVDQIVSLAEQK